MITTVVNHKGGVGKTITTVNLSAALGLKKKKILIIDNDPQSNATGILLKDKAPKNTLHELLDLDHKDKPDIQKFIYPTKSRNVWIIPNITDTSGLEIPMANNLPESQFLIRDLIRDYAKANFDATFIDCPPTLSLFVANAMNAADAVLIPVDAGCSYSIDNVQIVLDMIKGIRETTNPRLRFLRVFINRLDSRTTICKMLESEIRQKFGDGQVFETTMPASTLIQQAIYGKSTIFGWNQRARSAILFRKLAIEMSKLL